MGRGVAYSTTEPAHLLNVCAEGMSAWAGDPGHFARRFEAEGGSPHGFAQRRFFATYLREMLAGAVASGCIEPVEATAVSAAREGGNWKVGFADGSSVEAQILVLAIGNQEPDVLGAFAGVGRRFVGNPWDAVARAAVEDLAQTSGAALLVGTGLTMVDLVLSLDAAGHNGRIVALSRRGLVPRAHADVDPPPASVGQLPSRLRSVGARLSTASDRTAIRCGRASLRRSSGDSCGTRDPGGTFTATASPPRWPASWRG